jgi:hypothetical protein
MPHTCISLFAGVSTKPPALVATAATVYEGNDMILTCTGDTGDSANIAASYLFKLGAGTPVEKTGTKSAVYTKVAAVPADGGSWTCASKNSAGTGPYSTPPVVITVTGKLHSSTLSKKRPIFKNCISQRWAHIQCIDF